jgi:hypothetical protein
VVLNERTGLLWERVRRTLDGWFVRLPSGARAQIRDRFASSKDVVHKGAFWELYLHEVFLRLGFEVDVDIGRDDIGGRRPDFLLRKDDVEFYVGATAVQGDDVASPQQRQLLGTLRDLINHVASDDFLVGLYVEQYGTTTPGRRDITRPLARWLAEQDVDRLLEARRAGLAPAVLPRRFADWRIGLQAIPLEPEHRGQKDHGILGSTDEQYAEINDINPLLRKLKHKANHYGQLDRAYVVAALCAGPFVEWRDIEQSLFGASFGGFRQSNGFWMRPNGPTNTRVSAVLTAIDLSPTAVTVVEPCLWLNPWARCPLLAELPWERVDASTRGLIAHAPANASSAELFGLGQRWPATA